MTAINISSPIPSCEDIGLKQLSVLLYLWLNEWKSHRPLICHKGNLRTSAVRILFRQTQLIHTSFMRSVASCNNSRVQSNCLICTLNMQMLWFFSYPKETQTSSMTCITAHLRQSVVKMRQVS